MIDILVVEDNPLDARLFVEAFNKFKLRTESDFRVNIQVDGLLALDYLYKEGAYSMADHLMPSLIFLDLKLPTVDGYTILERLKTDSLTQKIPVIICSDLGGDSEDDCSELKADDFIKKSVSLEKFQQDLESIMLSWLKPLILKCDE